MSKKLTKDDKKVLMTLLLIAISFTLLAIGLIAVFEPESITQLINPKPTIKYSNINVSQAREIINDVTVIDVRGLEGCSQCQFNQGHLPGALLYTDPKDLYNVSNNLLIYSVNGEKGEWFCEQLMGNVYGKVYNLQGGWNAWKNYYERQLYESLGITGTGPWSTTWIFNYKVTG